MNQRFATGPVEAIPLRDVVEWVNDEGVSRLLLPPIQRSVVWRNDQIVNFWDSLLRGYPPGLMMAHRSGASRKGRTSDGHTVAAGAQDFHLFDGQQRLTAILLGLGAGQLNKRLKLWVDLLADPSDSPDLLFPLRITSTGQPFGYQAPYPNQKHPLEKRRARAEEWRKARNVERFDPGTAFLEASGSDLIDATGALELSEITRRLTNDGEAQARGWLQAALPDVRVGTIDAFLEALDGALGRPILFQLIDERVVEDESEYFRFFGRLGQGGTALSNDELTYSLIKHRYPEIHDRMKDISSGPAGRLASEVNLVLAALRLAKAWTPWDGAATWELIKRPGPAFVGQLRELPDVEDAFLHLVPPTRSGELQNLLEQLRGRLAYSRTDNPTGLPTMLLARLPHQLLDVLLLMASQADRGASSLAPDLLASFGLYWLLFVSNGDKAADLVFKRYRDGAPLEGRQALRAIVETFELEDCARPLPAPIRLADARAAIVAAGHKLRDWGDRYRELDTDDRRGAAALQHLTTDRHLIQNALLWSQRDYLTETFPGFDPTSARDEDLPIDLDHLVPRKYFAADWRIQRRRLTYVDADHNFRWRRGIVGHSLGNFRWLDASTNRGRGAGQLELTLADQFHVQDVAAWNRLLQTSSWTENEVAAFQRLIDLRSLDIYDALVSSACMGAFAVPQDEDVQADENVLAASSGA